MEVLTKIKCMRKIYFFIACLTLSTLFCSCNNDDNTQTKAQLEITPSSDIVFEVAGGKKTIAVLTDQAAWTVKSNQDWCEVTKNGSDTFIVSAAENETTNPMPQATVTVMAGEGEYASTVQFKVDQKGAEEPPVSDVTFEIKLSEPTASGVDVTVTPSSNEAVYYYDVLSVEVLKEAHSGDLAVYMTNMMKEAVSSFGSVEEAMKKLCTKGESSHSFSRLNSDTDYVAFAAGLNAQGVVNTEIKSVSFRTAALAQGLSFKIEFSNYAYDGVDYKITPSDMEARYYSAIRPAFAYRNMSDEEILNTVAAEDGFMIDFYATTGVSEYTNEHVWATDTEYLVVVFGWENYAPSTGLFKFPFRTSKPTIDPADCQFTVTPSDITSRSLKIKITPSDNTVMYMYDLIADEDYQPYKTDMESYVREYVQQGIAMLDNNRVRGEAGYSYQKMLEPGTTYYVWTACIGETGELESKVHLSDPIQTLPNQLSKATVTATVNKYFNGDDLYAKDPVKYASYQGKAYVSVTFEATDAATWYGTLVEENPRDPTSAISDAEIIEGLVNGNGTFCPTGKLYLCNWDVENTILAVGVGTDDNTGALLRQTHVFTKDGAAPVSEFVDPSMSSLRAQAFVSAKYVASVKNYK